MPRRVDPAELIDSRGVAELLGLKRLSSVAVYRGRYADFPAPVVDMGVGRCLLWLRSDVVTWDSKRSADR